MSNNERAGQADQEAQKDQGFINTQQHKLTDLIAQAVTAAMVVQWVSNAEETSNNEGNNRSSTAEVFSNSTNLTDLTISVILPQLTHWKADEISLFDSHLNKSYKDSEIVTVSKDVYYWSVMLFIECI